MTFDDFISKINGQNVLYIQQQCDNFRSEEYKSLSDDVNEFDWVKNSLGTPDAVNIWMGENRSVTSLHKDHYENLHAVILGEKTFTLYPPTDLPFLYQRVYQTGRFDENMKIIPDEPKNEVPWISVDPTAPNFDKFPLYEFATPYTVKLRAGDVLYLPSLWFHSVTLNVDMENQLMISYNVWYDMIFGPNYNSYKFLENCVEQEAKVKIRNKVYDFE
jgi:jumonji domain-containing protein 7